MRCAAMGFMPFINLRLQGFALRQQRLIGIAMRIQHIGAGRPKRLGAYLKTLNRLIGNKIGQLFVNLQSGNAYAFSHRSLPYGADKFYRKL